MDQISIFKRQYIKTKTPECQTLRCIYKNIQTATTNVYELTVFIVCDFICNGWQKFRTDDDIESLWEV